MDFLQIKVQLSRTPDAVAPIPINLPKYWAMVVQGVVFNFDGAVDNNATKKNTVIYIKKDANNFYRLCYDKKYGVFAFDKIINGATVQKIVVDPFIKCQTVNLLMEQNSQGMVVRALRNNDVVVKQSNMDISILSGILSVYLLYSDISNYSQADAFAQSFKLLDLERCGWQNGIPDAEAESILKGIRAGFEPPLLIGDIRIFSNNQYYLAGSADLYINNYRTRSITTGFFMTTDRENRIVIADGCGVRLATDSTVPDNMPVMIGQYNIGEFTIGEVK
jgi:hypothetical protein